MTPEELQAYVWADRTITREGTGVTQKLNLIERSVLRDEITRMILGAVKDAVAAANAIHSDEWKDRDGYEKGYEDGQRDANAWRTRLTPSEQLVMELRLGLPPHHRAYSIVETARILKRTQERVRQIEAKAREKMAESAQR